MLGEMLQHAQVLWNSQKRYLIFDTNLFDRSWRHRFFTAATEEGRELMFIHCRATAQDIFRRTEKKFGDQVNFDPGLLSVSDIVGFVERRAEPLSYAELQLLEAYCDLSTSGTGFAKVYLTNPEGTSEEKSTADEIFKSVTSDIKYLDLDEYSTERAFGKETVSGFEQSYQGMLRSRLGSKPIIVPAVRAVTFDEAGDSILLIRRRDDSRWALPAGGIELGESINAALVREFTEETGLLVSSAVLFAIHSGPKHAFTNRYGDQLERITFCFKVSHKASAPRKTTSETIDLKYFAISDLPELSAAHHATIEHCMEFSGTVILD